MHTEIEDMIYSREVIEERVKELAAQVLAVYREKQITVAVVLRGAFIFAADLVRHLPQDIVVEFVQVESYHDGREPQSDPQVTLPERVDWTGRHVLLVEDIVDTGHSIAALQNTLRAAGAASVRVCAFLDKPARRERDVDVEFLGFTLEGEPFVVGYGLDHAGRYRNLPYVGTLAPDDGAD